MKMRKLAVILIAAFAASTASAAEDITLESIAAESGLRARDVQMVLGAPAAFAAYRPSYQRARARLLRTYGAQGLDELAAAWRAGELDARAG